MPTQVEATANVVPPRLGKVGTLARLALIGVILAAIGGALAYLRGWFTPGELTPRGSSTDSRKSTDCTLASAAITPRDWAFRDTLKAMATACDSPRHLSFNLDDRP